MVTGATSFMMPTHFDNAVQPGHVGPQPLPPHPSLALLVLCSPPTPQSDGAEDSLRCELHAGLEQAGRTGPEKDLHGAERSTCYECPLTYFPHHKLIIFCTPEQMSTIQNAFTSFTRRAIVPALRVAITPWRSAVIRRTANRA